MADYETNLRQLFVETLQSYVGRKEADGSHRKIIDLYNEIRPLPRGYAMSYSDPWCAAFISAGSYATGLLDVVLPECGCEPMLDLYKARGQWVSGDDAQPLRPGDIVMYDWDGGAADHVGVVVEATDTEILVIEGNISDSVGYRRIGRREGTIKGFCLPAFDTVTQEAPVSSGATGYFAPAAMRLLTMGMSGQDVCSMQRLLIGRGFNCGRWRDDSDFGPDTFASLCEFQTSVGLYPSGELDPDTFTALWG